MKPVSRIFNFFVFSFSLIFLSVNLSAQLIKYVSYFPIPYASHSQVTVKTLSLLGTKNGGEVVLGSGANPGGFTVSTSFTAQDLSIKTASPGDKAPDISAGTNDSSGYNGTLSTVGDIGIIDLAPKLESVEAQGTAIVRGIYWDGKGGIGRSPAGASNWPASCELKWEDLKIKGSDSYRTYLTCASSSVIEEPETPDAPTVTYQPYTKQIAVAGYCETGHYAYFIDWGKEYRYNTMDEKKFSYYRYAASITVTTNSVYDNDCYCAAGALSSGGMQEIKESGAPWAGTAVGIKAVGHIKEHDYTFNNTYSIGDCPTNLSEQQICDKYCSGNSCNYACVKSRTIGTECGTALDTYECFCPKYGCCGLCENGTGQPACGALSCEMSSCCSASKCGREMSCAGSSSGACGEMTKHRKYEPTIGQATVLACNAVVK